MTFAYNAGSTTPTYAGLVEFNGVRLNDGTYKTQVVPPINSTAPVRSTMTDLASDHGAYASPAFLSGWEFDIDGWLWVPSGPDDVPPAIDYLRSAFTISGGFATLKLNARGWSEARQMTCRMAGPVQIVAPDLATLKVPRRDFVITLQARDPHVYSSTLHSVASTGLIALSNAGTVDTPFTVRFNGARTNPVLTDGSGNTITYTGTIGAGHWVEISTNPATGVTAVDDTGANVMANVSAFKARTIPPGASGWVLTSSSGAGSATVSWRDAWS